MPVFKAGVIGLGNIGFKFNLDTKRKNTWSHVSAYDKCSQAELAGAVDIDKKQRDQFGRYFGSVPVFENVSQLFKNLPVDIISICTPTASHYPVLREVISHPVKAIFCEKPLASDIHQAREMVRMCKERGILLAVNHGRRWQSNYLCARQMILDKKIGKVKAVTALYPGRIFNIGSHILDAIRMLVPHDAKTVSGISFDPDNPDPSISGWIEFSENIPCALVATGKREDLVVEMDIIGDQGRIKLLENGNKIEYYSFSESNRYSGYRELKPSPFDKPRQNDGLVDAVDEICTALRNKKNKIQCSGEDGLAALVLVRAMLESARRNGQPIKLEKKYALSGITG
ncbi:MAG: Gfo/Idh/MocA family oxidoreductase [Candidatus Omnitrophota bacterium]|jgi:predicted dehydrogenase